MEQDGVKVPVPWPSRVVAGGAPLPSPCTVVLDDPSKEATESSDYFLVVCGELSTTARHLEIASYLSLVYIQAIEVSSSERKPNLHHADMLHDERAFVIPHTIRCLVELLEVADIFFICYPSLPSAYANDPRLQAGVEGHESGGLPNLTVPPLLRRVMASSSSPSRRPGHLFADHGKVT